MKAVHILRGVDRVEHLLRGVLAHPRWERRLHEDPVAGLIAVELPDQVQYGVERARRRQAVNGDTESGLAARALLVADVHVRGRVVTHQHDVQSGRPPGLTPKRVDLWC